MGSGPLDPNADPSYFRLDHDKTYLRNNENDTHGFKREPFILKIFKLIQSIMV